MKPGKKNPARDSSPAGPAHLVVPAQEAQAAGGRLGRVETGSAPGVVVVDPGRLRDAVKQLAVGRGGAQVQVLAHGLRFQQTKPEGVDLMQPQGQTTQNLPLKSYNSTVDNGSPVPPPIKRSFT